MIEYSPWIAKTLENVIYFTIRLYRTLMIIFWTWIFKIKIHIKIHITQQASFTMRTSIYGNIFRVNDPLCGNSPVSSLHKGQWRGSLVFLFYLRLNKRLSKQSRCRWFETPLCSLWRHCNAWLLIGWHLWCQPIKGRVWNVMLIEMAFNMKVLSNPWSKTQL